ncbi:GAF and ANTAR domain-containing protein [Kribbella sp. NPDC003557]|uniref:GAF and ANTAR domain-containing protein n=1 Tax=Kribbella sp. NPDC003557 TaxID=3154449 RepID=UPI0033B85BDA
MVSGLSFWIGPARERAAIERDRADRSAAIARRHERLLITDPASMRALHQRMAAVHRRGEERHLTAAKLHEAHIRRLTRWFSADDLDEERPRLISAVAELTGARSAGLTLLDSWRTEASVTGSDEIALAAQDLELTLGEGPMHDSTSTGRPVVATGEALWCRWQHYSPAIAALGVHALAVVPLGPPDRCVGALTVLDPPRPELPGPLTGELEELADALTHTMLLTAETVAGLAPEASGTADVLDSPNQRLVLHQAVGMVAAQNDCSVDDASSLIRAWAFAHEEQVTEVARRIVAKRLRLDTR